MLEPAVEIVVLWDYKGMVVVAPAWEEWACLLSERVPAEMVVQPDGLIVEGPEDIRDIPVPQQGEAQVSPALDQDKRSSIYTPLALEAWQ